MRIRCLTLAICPMLLQAQAAFTNLVTNRDGSALVFSAPPFKPEIPQQVQSWIGGGTRLRPIQSLGSRSP